MSDRQTGPFPVTQWSLVDRAGQDGESARRALGQLLERYRPALESHLIRRKGIREDEVDDFLQGFVSSKILEKNILAQADRERGKFRTFLLTVLDRYVANERRRRRPAPLDGDMNLADPSAGPDEQYHHNWAREVVSTAIERMRQECERSGRTDVWAIFERRLLGPVLREADPPPYEALVERFGFRSPMQAANLLITGKRMFVRALRSVVGEYAAEREVEAEIADLQEILSRGA